MKHTLSAAFLLCLATTGFAQLGPFGPQPGLGKHPGSSIAYVAPSPAPDPGAVEVRGQGLDLITAARVNGVEVPIVASNYYRLVLRPPAQNPGFGALELVRPQDFLPARIEFLPSLAARWTDGQMQVRLHDSEHEWYIVWYSFRRLDEMLVFPGAYYGQMLDLTVPNSGVLFSGMTSTEPIVFPWVQIPRSMRGRGGLLTVRPMSIQAMCGGDHFCYSNMVTLQPTL